MSLRDRHFARHQAAQRLRRRQLTLESLEARQLLAGVELLNLNTTPFHSNPSQLVTVGIETFFTAQTASGTAALWKTDGTNAGTTMVKDFGDTVRQPRSLTNVDGTLFFSNHDETGYELWKSDGTAAGTVQVLDIFEGQAGSYPQELTAVGSTLFFRAFNTSGSELWKSDGTAAGTVRVKDIVSGAGGGDPQQLINVGGTLFFTATNATWGRELWKSGGTAATTTIVRNINGGSASSQPTDMANVNGTLYFAATDSTGGRELWKSNGTTDTTKRVRDIFVGGNSAPAELTAVGSTVYFSATDAAGGRELWQSDGTYYGTKRVADIASGSDSSYPTGLTNVDGKLFFAAAAQPGFGQLWFTAGGGATQIGQFFVNPSHLINVSGTLFFTGVDATGGRELWKATVDDNQGLSTIFVKDIYPDSIGSYPDSFVNANGSLLFAAADNVSGREIWSSDGTTDGTQSIKDLVPGSESSHPDNFVNVNGTVFFTAYDSSTGYELWKTDGTDAGTMLVADIYPGGLGSSPSNLVNVNGTLYFAATDPDAGRELWKSDGTWGGTVLVKDVLTGLDSNGVPNSSSPTQLVNLNGQLVFAAENSLGVELWRSNGTASGTVLLKDIFGGSSSSNPSELINVSGTLFFRARDASGQELWKSNGTTAGTVMVRDLYAGAANSFPSRFTNVSGTLMFTATNASGVELWKSDGTAAGTFRVKDIFSGSGSSTPAYLTNVAGTLYFSAKTGAAGRELWKSDGTGPGTVLVKDIYAGTSDSYPNDLINVGGMLFFGARTATGGLELWKSDGTSAGTVQVKDIVAGASGSNLTDLFNVNGILYFSAKDQAGYELWQSDGTASGTVRIADLASGSPSSEPTNFGQGNGVLLMAATALEGEELYAMLPAFNIAPVLAANPVPTFGSINEDARTPNGSLVQYLVSTTQTDANESALKGIAVVAASTANGIWQYSLDNGATWRAMGNVSSTDARLLPATSSARVRFIPKANFNGNVYLGYRAWDRTQGAPGSLFDLTDHLGGSTAFSIRQKSAQLMVNPINDAPVVNKPANPMVPMVEDVPAGGNTGELVRDLIFGTIGDPDAGAEKGIAVIDDGPATQGKWQFSLNDGTSWQDFADPDGSTARLLAADSMTRVRFLPAPNFSGNAKLTYRGWDQTAGTAGAEFNITQTGGSTAFSFNTGIASQIVTPVNDAPKLDNTSDFMLPSVSKTGSNPGVFVKDLIAGKVTDVDPDAVFGIAVVKAGDLFTSTYYGHWEFTINDGLKWELLNVEGDRDAVLLQADDLTRVRFVPLDTSSPPFMTTFEFRAWDQTEGIEMVGLPEGFDCSDKLGDSHAFSNQKGIARLVVSM